MFFGTDVPYARYHQEGGGHLPRREMVFITKRDQSDIGRIASRWLVEGLKK
jgi:hypothetical protein